MSETQFSIITPEKRNYPPSHGLDVDVARSFNLLTRPQRPQLVGIFGPLALLNAQPVEAQEYILIKAPNSPVFIPDWARKTGIPQLAADHRYSVSRDCDREWWLLTYERRLVYKGQPARPLPDSLHIDDLHNDLLSGTGRVDTIYIGYNSIPTVFADLVTNRLSREDFDVSAAQELTYLRKGDWYEAAEVNGAFYRPLVKDEYSFPPGNLLCFNGATVHRVGKAEENGWRAMMHIRCTTDQPERVWLSTNPPLKNWLDQPRAF